MIIPVVDVLHRVSLRIVTMPIQSQGIITRDNVSVDVSAVAYFRVVDAVKSVVAIENVNAAINQIAQTTLRKVVGQHTLDETLSETDRINVDIREILDVTTTDWGVEVTLVELKDIQLPESMKRAMARQAEAEREKRAKIINAEGESMAAAALGDASDTMMAHPLALQLRNLQSLVEIGVDKNTTVVFPAPLMSTIGELGSFLAREQAAADGRTGVGHGSEPCCPRAGAQRVRRPRAAPARARGPLPTPLRRPPGRACGLHRGRPPAGGCAGVARWAGSSSREPPRGCHDAPMTVNHSRGWPADLRLLDAFDAAAFAVDAGGQVVHANETAERLFGRPGGVLVGETLMTHLFSENEQESLAVVVRQVLDGRPWRGRLDVRHTDGSVHQAELSCSPLWRDEVVVGHLCVVDDTGTERGAVREARRLGDRLTRLARVDDRAGHGGQRRRRHQDRRVTGCGRGGGDAGVVGPAGG